MSTSARPGCVPDWKLERYLLDTVAWEVVAQQYGDAYTLANKAVKGKTKASLPLEF